MAQYFKTDDGLNIKQRQHAYGAIVYGGNAYHKKQSRRLPSILNQMKRHSDKIIDEYIEKNINGVDDAQKRAEARSKMRIVKYLLFDFNQIGLWRPFRPQDFPEPDVSMETIEQAVDGKAGKETDKARRAVEKEAMRIVNDLIDKHGQGLLSLKDHVDLMVGYITSYERGGITPYRLYQVTHGIADKALEDLGDTVLQKEITDDNLKDWADQYNSEKDNNTYKFTEVEGEQESEEYVDEDSITVDQILEGDVKLSDVEDDDLLDQAYDLCENGGKKGAITRELQKRES